MLRPLFDQKKRFDGRIGFELKHALGWWQRILEMNIAEVREWDSDRKQPVHLFCDARGEPPHAGAVLFCDGRVCFTHTRISPAIMYNFKRRADSQTMGLEL